MQITKRRRNRLLIPALIVALVLGVGVAVIAFSWWPFNDDNNTSSSETGKIDLSAPSDEQIKQGEDIKKQTIENDDKSKDTAANTSDELSNTITVAEVTDGTLYVRNEIEGVYQTGSCDLTLTKEGSIVTHSAGIQPLAKTSTCKGFNVVTSDLSPGRWTIKLNVTINGRMGSTSAEVTI